MSDDQRIVDTAMRAMRNADLIGLYHDMWNHTKDLEGPNDYDHPEESLAYARMRLEDCRVEAQRRGMYVPAPIRRPHKKGR